MYFVFLVYASVKLSLLEGRSGICTLKIEVCGDGAAVTYAVTYFSVSAQVPRGERVPSGGQILFASLGKSHPSLSRFCLKAHKQARAVVFVFGQVPSRTAVDMQTATVAELAKHPRIVGLKDVSVE